MSQVWYRLTISKLADVKNRQNFYGVCIYRYSSVEEYERINIPLLMRESAERSVRAGLPSIHIKNVTIKWSKDLLGGTYCTFFSLTTRPSKTRSTK